MSKHDEPRGFLNRWSARKQAAGKEPQVTEVPTVAEPGEENSPTNSAALWQDEAPANVPVPKESDAAPSSADSDETPMAETPVATPSPAGSTATEPVLGDADMPPIASLNADSDLSAFFSKGVSAALRKAALRHVFQQPSFNVRDGLNDYDGDFTSFEPLGDTITSDMKFHAARKEKARLEAEREEAERLAAEEAEAEELARQSHADAEAETDDSAQEEPLEQEPVETIAREEATETDAEADVDVDAEQLVAADTVSSVTPGEDTPPRNQDTTAG